MKTLIRCPWVKLENPLYVTYHDEEWGKPSFDDARHFEYLILETFQAGLSWEIVLNKREAFRKAMWRFQANKLSKATEKDVENWMKNPLLIRHKAKLKAAITNANVFLTIQKEFGSFHRFLMQYFPQGPLRHEPHHINEIPTNSKESQLISTSLKARGMKFIGPTIVYAHLQAIGIVDDHMVSCFCKSKS